MNLFGKEKTGEQTEQQIPDTLAVEEMPVLDKLILKLKANNELT